jgi:hypothetical protein
MDLGASMSLMICLQSWSESMALAPWISWISLCSPQNLSFWVHPKSEWKIFGFEKNLFWELVPYIEVTLVSMFHLVWWSIAQESTLGRKGWILGEVCDFQRPPARHCMAQPDSVWLTVSARHSLTILSNWSHSFSAAFVTSRGSFLNFWLVCSSPSCSVLSLEFELVTYAGSYKRIWLGSRSPTTPLVTSLGPSIDIREG